jgi:hypothetical protein
MLNLVVLTTLTVVGLRACCGVRGNLAGSRQAMG